MAAPAPSSFHFYEDTFHNLNAALGTYVNDVATSVIGSISHVARDMLLIYMALWGWAMFRGMISEPITDGAARIIRLTVIVALALNLSHYNTYVSNFLWNTPDAMAGIVANGYGDQNSNVQYLDGLMSRLYDLGNAYYEKAFARPMNPFPDLGMLATAIVIWIAGVAATAYAAFLLALCKMALAILLGIGPIFILLLVFEGTKRFFEAWLGQALNYVFLVILTAAAVKLILTLITHYLDIAQADAEALPAIEKALPAIVTCLIAALVMMQLPSKASALGGGAAISTLGAVGWAYGRAKGTMTALRPTNLKRSYNRARSDVRIAAGAAKSIASAPVTVPRAVYRKVASMRPNTVRKSS